GIAQVEPISFGGICIFSNVCGCAGFIDKVTGSQPTPNVIVADYTALHDRDIRPEHLLSVGRAQRNQIEHEVAEQVAHQLIDRLPHTPREFTEFIDRGYDLAKHMSWDAVARDYVLPGINRAAKAQRLTQVA
ncbi:MAG: hypothetical protein ABSH20_07185, partial [Tepidisphaeraceae bacterium]